MSLPEARSPSPTAAYSAPCSRLRFSITRSRPSLACTPFRNDPWWKKTPEETIVIRPMMYVALTYDHRLIDGKEAVSFLRRVKELVEDPWRLLIEV